MWIDSPCVHCQQRITFEAPAIGYQFACPHCGGCLEVPAPPPLPPPQVASTGETAAVALLAIAGGGLSGIFLVGKGIQYATDSWEGAGPDSVEFSASFKQAFNRRHQAPASKAQVPGRARSRRAATLHRLAHACRTAHPIELPPR